MTAWGPLVGLARKASRSDFRLPYLCFEKEWNGQLVAIAVLPLGFILSVGIVQFVERPVARLAGLEDACEVRPDRPLPDYRLKSIYQIYIDNFDTFQVVSKERAALLRGTVGDAQGKLRGVKGTLGIPLTESKAIVGESDFVVFGAAFGRMPSESPELSDSS